MNEIGLFEAKTRFSEICADVAAKGTVVIVTRRGKPLVKIEPISRTRNAQSSVWDRRALIEKREGRVFEEFSLPKRQKQTWSSALDT